MDLIIPEKKIRKLITAVMKKPYVDIIGHPDDGRFPVDYEVLVQTAKETKTLLEINNSSLKTGWIQKKYQGKCVANVRIMQTI